LKNEDRLARDKLDFIDRADSWREMFRLMLLVDVSCLGDGGDAAIGECS